MRKIETLEYPISGEDKATARLAEFLALECGICPSMAEKIRIAAALHDLGKQKIPASILNKPGKLSPKEYRVLKTHTTLGAEMLASIQGELGVMARATALYHHEYYDGSGYFGKRTEELPFYLPMVTISDIFIALIVRRPYKKAWTKADALSYIQGQAGKRFNPALVEVFLSLMRRDDRVSAALFDLRK